ncbi:MAG TPA: CDP-diacylglycerol--serine O-phosphatidyltransferase [Verrucomicrobiales bacterium]|nr:CDP-diacylglycerol--serine O-phosphatidyltransferase [Verrucomicrobiales bacterium]
MPEPQEPAAPPDAESELKIYFLPNLMTAGNLFCGFVALTRIVQADLTSDAWIHDIRSALGFILLACIFDLLDGRLARWGGHESPFGREFDSLADIISFGAAPAFLVHRIVLKDVFAASPELGWFIASVYLICGALRLARFNCLAAMPNSTTSKEFLGFPIPAAAGLVSSITLFLLWFEEQDFNQGYWRYLLPVLMIFLSVMMVSKVRYPSFKSINLKTRRNFTKTVIAVLFVGVILVLREKILYWVLPLFFTAYLVYGFIRPHISREIIHEIEDEEDDEEEAPRASA